VHAHHEDDSLNGDEEYDYPLKSKANKKKRITKEKDK